MTMGTMLLTLQNPKNMQSDIQAADVQKCTLLSNAYKKELLVTVGAECPVHL